MDMGFWPDVQRIIAALPPERQTLLFSATMPGEIMKLVHETLRAPRYVQVGANRGAARTIRHSIEMLPRAGKIDWLAHFVQARRHRPGAGVRADEDRRRPRGAAACRPSASAPRRCTPIARSRNGCRRSKASAPASIRCSSPPTSPRAASTSKASRTSSISRSRTTPEAYVHRVGRTGRSGAEGHAITLVAPEEQRAWRALENRVGLQLQ